MAEAGITPYGGVIGSTDKAVEDLICKKFEYNADTTCSHGGDHHHGVQMEKDIPAEAIAWMHSEQPV